LKLADLVAHLEAIGAAERLDAVRSYRDQYGVS
jgi:hypothetical protein